MPIASRCSQILKIVSRFGRVSVTDLSEQLNFSVETIRRDLKKLGEQGDIVRVHGGAVSKNYLDEGTSFNNRAGNNVDDKKYLVEQAISHFCEGAVIGLDASSSSWLVAHALPDVRCTVVTNSINNINALSGKKNVSVVSVGGYYSEKYKAFYGLIARNALMDMSLDICVISCVGFDMESGVWDSNEYNYEIKKILIDISNSVLLIADKSKFRKRGLLKICNLNDVDILVSNADL